MVGGSSRAANTLRKEKSTSVKAMMSVRSTAPVESVPRPSTSSSKRSSGGPKISIRMFGRGPDILGSVSLVEVSLDIEDKKKGTDDYRVARSLLKSIILPTDVQTFEEVVSAFPIQDSYDSLLRLVYYVDHFAEVIREVRRLSKKADEKAAQANQRADNARVESIEAFRTLEEFSNIKADFASLSYLQGGIDLKEKIQRILLDLNLDLLESDDEEVEKVEDQKIQMEDVFSPARDDPTVEDATLVPPPAIITLPNQAKVSKSRAVDGA
ncbi:hypothetical protein COCNU_scaffold044868G000010 [Cocos nucifera]|nr:hypothetical protein [Cocos nucifera]